VKLRRVIHKRIRRGGRSQIAADVHAVIAANVGERSQTTSAKSVVQGRTSSKKEE